ncbi:MAG TPA: MBL fold metallo-hydrolase [Dehalococcoidia bacterium]|nr:MBL fold metallo-hydrolase [Dehalococcoidia bacterium]
MRITIVYDNEVSQPGLESGWGFSCLIETESRALILFDTGADGATLLYNMRELGIDPSDIAKVVISHAHGDHTGGLQSLLEVNDGAEIYLPSSLMALIPGRKVTPVRQSVQIAEDVFSTGELKEVEQSLVLRTKKGIVVLTGCSHPGVGEILQAASRLGRIYGIIGGFHGFYDFERLKGLSLICPCHCTQYKSEILRLFPDSGKECGAGLVLKF